MRCGGHCAGFVAVVLAVSLGACGTFVTRDTRLQAVKTVGIISAIGDEMSVARAGLTGLNNTNRSLSIEAWGLDDLVVQQAATALSVRFNVQPVSYRRAAFAAITDSPIRPMNLVRGDPFNKLVQTEVSPQGLDAYVVITKARSSVGSGRYVEGIGLIEYRTLLASHNQLHALYEIRVFEGKTFKVIEKRAAQPLDNPEGLKLAGPSRTVDEAIAPGKDDAAQNERLRAAVADLLARSLATTLGDMHLAEAR